MDHQNNDRYQVLPEELERFQRDGYVHLKNVVSEAELMEIEAITLPGRARAPHIHAPELTWHTTPLWTAYPPCSTPEGPGNRSVDCLQHPESDVLSWSAEVVRDRGLSSWGWRSCRRSWGYATTPPAEGTFRPPDQSRSVHRARRTLGRLIPPGQGLQPSPQSRSFA